MAPIKINSALVLHLCLSLRRWTSPMTRPPWHAAQAYTSPIATKIRTLQARRRGLRSLSPDAGRPTDEAPRPDLDSGIVNPRTASAAVAHHVAVKTRDIMAAIDFYSLLGFRVEARFVAGPSRCAWLLHEGDACADDRDNCDD